MERATSDANDKVREGRARLHTRVYEHPHKYCAEKSKNWFDVRAKEDRGRFNASLGVILSVLGAVCEERVLRDSGTTYLARVDCVVEDSPAAYGENST